MLMIAGNALFSTARSFWPLDRRIEVLTSQSGEFICSPSLVDLYRSIEVAIGPVDEWGKVAAWSFHQALWELADRAYQDGSSEVYARDVQYKDFDRLVLENLSGDEWEDMRQKYLSVVRDSEFN